MTTLPTPTPNLKLQPIEANRNNWSALMNRNLRMIDASVGTYFAVQNLQGVWQNGTAYTAGQAIIDEEASTVYQTQEDHISSSIPTTFSEERAAHPDRWSIYSSPARARGVWLPATSYALNDFVVSGAQYAIAVETHVSGDSFNVDASAGKWAILVDLSAVGSTVLPVPGGIVDANKFVALNSLGSGYDTFNASQALAMLGSSEIGRTLFSAISASAARAAIGAQVAGSYQPLNPTLTTLATFTLGAFADDVLGTANAAGMRTLLGLTVLATLIPGSGITTFLTTPSSANLQAAVTDETGTGELLFANSPTLTGNPTTPNRAEYSNNTSIANTAYADRTAKILKTQTAQTGSYLASAGTAIPFDNTIPQNDEGDEFLTISFTPKSDSSRLFIEASWNGSRDGADTGIIAIFQNNDADALTANVGYFIGSGTTLQLRASVDILSPGTSAITFRVRVGSNTGAILYMNGTSSGLMLGGRMRSFIRVVEYV